MCRRSIGREREVREAAGENADDSSRIIPGCSITTIDVVLKAELRMYSLEENRDMGN